MGDVPTGAVLDWLAKCLKVHANTGEHAGVNALILPTALSERERWVSLIAEVLLQEDGVLVDATAVGDSGVRCGDIEVDAPGMCESIRELLVAFNRSDPGADLRLVIDGDLARVEGSQDYSAVNAAQRAVREIATALCSDDLRSTPLVALVYAEDALDATNAHAIWRLVMGAPELLGLPNASTLLLVAGDGVLRFDMHCTGERGLRYWLSNGGEQERKTWAQNRAVVRNLKRYGDEAMPLVPLFLGAGASVAAELPTGDRLRNYALSGLTSRHVDSGTWRDVASEWFHELKADGALHEEEESAGADSFVSKLTLERVLEVEQHVEAQPFSTTLRYFAALHASVIESIIAQRLNGELVDDPLRKLLAVRQRLVLITVNFDQVIEAKADNDVEVFYSEADLARLPSYLDHYKMHGGAVPLLKLHGDISEPDTLVANLATTAAGLSGARNAALGEIVARVTPQAQRPWWYIGYSMRDVDLANMWTNPHFADTMNEHWVAPFMDAHVERFVARHRLTRWRGMGGREKFSADERLLTLTADDAYRLLHDEVAVHW